MSDYKVMNFGDLEPGDKIVGSDGELTEVTDVYDKHIPDKMYELEMEDGQTFKAGGNHLWYSETEIDERNKGEYIRLAKEFFANNEVPKVLKHDEHFPINIMVNLFGEEISTGLFIEKACRTLGYSSYTPMVYQEIMKSGVTRTISKENVYSYSYNNLIEFLLEMKASLESPASFMFGEVRTTDDIFKIAKHVDIDIPTLSEMKKRRSLL